MSVTRNSIPADPSNYYVGRRDVIKYIVIHTGETDEGTTPAEGMGNWFGQVHPSGQRSSAHQGVDTDSICTYVADGNTAFGAPGVNATGWHLEHAGRAGQTAGQWDDAASRLILANGALAAAEASKRLGIPARWLTDVELRAGNVKGFITHAQASRVLGGTHWDPGPNFPADKYMAMVRAHLAGQETDDMFEPTDRATLERAKAVNDSNSIRLQTQVLPALRAQGDVLKQIVKALPQISEDVAAAAAAAIDKSLDENLTPQVIADAIPDALAQQVVDALAARLAKPQES